MKRAPWGITVALLAFTTVPSTAGAAACTFSETEQSLVNCGAIKTASGSSRFRVREDCDQDLRIEIEDVPKGSYTVYVDGVKRGIIKVGHFGEGSIEFSTDADEPGELPLNFDPSGHIDIAVKNRVFLSLGSCPAH